MGSVEVVFRMGAYLTMRSRYLLRPDKGKELASPSVSSLSFGSEARLPGWTVGERGEEILKTLNVLQVPLSMWDRDVHKFGPILAYCLSGRQCIVLYLRKKS